MSNKTLTYQEAALILISADPLTDIRIAIGWKNVNGQRIPVLRLSSRSITRYTEKAKPLGTIHGFVGGRHLLMLLNLVDCWTEAEA